MDPTFAAVLDELEKTAASSGMFAGIKSRVGRRPMRVETLLKKASVLGSVGAAFKNEKTRVGRIAKHLDDHGSAYDLAGLGVLAAPSALDLGHEAKNKLEGKKVDMHHVGHGVAEIAGLGAIAAPVAAAMLRGKKH